jgi:F0F1-type ATP synthase assembly protein I
MFEILTIIVVGILIGFVCDYAANGSFIVVCG